MKEFLKKIVAKLGYKISSTKFILTSLEEDENLLKLNFDLVVAGVLLRKNDPNDFNFIQVGAFDGITCDPLRKYLAKYNWTGLMAEPQPMPFEALQSLYGSFEKIKLLNAAIGHRDGDMKLYILEGDNLPNWSKGMASFSRNNLVKHAYLIHDIEKHIKEITVPIVTFNEIFKIGDIKELDLLQIDTEGFDAKIIRLFPFTVCKPLIIHFESKHIEKNELDALLRELIALDYLVARDGSEDMLAVQKNLFA